MTKLSAANRDRIDTELPTTFPRGGVCFRKFPVKFLAKFLDKFLGVAMLVALASCLSLRGAQAGDLEDCNGSVAEKIEAGCTAILDNPARTPEDGLKALTNRSRLYANRSKFDAALADAEAALQLNAQSVPALLIRGYVYQRKNNFESALADFDQAAGIDPKNFAPYLSRGNLRLVQRNWTEAQKDFEQALALRADLSLALVGRGRVYLETGQIDKALADLDAAIASNINAPNAFYWRGQIYRRKGDTDRAIEDFSRAAVQAPPSDIGPYLARGQLYSAKGDYARAIADFDKVLSIAPDDKYAQQLRQSTLALQAEMKRIHDTPASPVAQLPAPPTTPSIPAPTATAPVRPSPVQLGPRRQSRSPIRPSFLSINESMRRRYRCSPGRWRPIRIMISLCGCVFWRIQRQASPPTRSKTSRNWSSSIPPTCRCWWPAA